MQELNTKTTAMRKPYLMVLIPVFEDWKVADLLTQQLDRVFGKAELRGEIVFIGDGSLSGLPTAFPSIRPQNFDRINVLELRKNLGHQRALCVGLVCLHGNNPRGAVLVMDADGEDAPSDVPRLLEEFVREQQRR